MSNQDIIKSLKHDDSYTNVKHILNYLANDDYALLLKNNVDDKLHTIKLVKYWINHDKGHNASLDKMFLNKLKDSSFKWYNQTTLHLVNAKDVINMIKSLK